MPLGNIASAFAPVTGAVRSTRSARFFKSLKNAANIVGAILFVCSIFQSSAFASHYRYGNISWRLANPVSAPRTVTFTITQAWRATYVSQNCSPFTLPVVGQPITCALTTLDFGDATSQVNIVPTCTSINVADDWFFGTFTVTHTYAGAGTSFTAGYANSARFGSVTTGAEIGVLQNNNQQAFSSQTIVNLVAGNTGSPVASMPPVITIPTNSAASTFSIPATDPDNTTLIYSSATQAQLGGGGSWVQAPGFSITFAGVPTFNTVGKAVGTYWNAGVNIVDASGSNTLLDFLIYIVPANTPPIFITPTPANNTVYNINPGQNVSFTVKASDADAGSTVTLSAIGLPSANYTFTPGLPTTASTPTPVSSAFSFTPSNAQLGIYVITFIATRNGGVQTNTTVTINVNVNPQFDPPTPAQGSTQVILSGVLHQDNIAANNPDPNVQTEIASAISPSGSTFSPALPTAFAATPTSVLSWTPAASNFGANNVSITAQDANGRTVTRNYTLAVNTVPVFASSPITTATSCTPYSYQVVATDDNIPFGDNVAIVNADGPFPAWLSLVSTGNGTATLSGTPTASDAGSYTITLGAQDFYYAATGTPTQTFTITVGPDIIPPTLAAIADVSSPTDAGQCGAVVTFSTTAADACSSPVVITYDHASGSLFPVGTTPVIVTATDASNNVAKDTFSVTITDVEPPTITPPANIIVNADPGQCSASSVTLGIPTTHDNCGVPSVTNNAPASFPVGNTDVTWTVIDVHNLTATALQTVTVRDAQPPVPNVPANMSVPTDAGKCSAIVNFSVSASDNCPGAIATANPPSGSVFPAGTTTVIVTAQDQHGNISSRNFTVTVNDPGATSFTGLDVYAQSSTRSTSCDAIVTYPLAASSNATNVSYVLTGATIGSGSGTGSGAVFDKGVTHVVVTAANSCHSANVAFDITVVDNVPPVTLCKPATVILDANGNGSITSATIDNGSHDNCGPVTMSIIGSGTICGEAAENNSITLTAPAGATITGIVFASYGTPTGTCGHYAIGGCNASSSMSVVSSRAIGQHSVTIPATNGTFGDPCVGTVKHLFVQATYSGISNSGAFNCSNIGNNQVTLIATDASGNASNCSATVTVIDNIRPTISAPASITNIPAVAGTCRAAVSLGTPAVNDNCSATFANDAPSTFPLGTTVVTWTATDPSGNSASAAQSVTVVSPEIDVQGNAISISSGDVTPSTLDGSDFGGILPGGNVTHTFSVSNTGTSTLNLTGSPRVNITGPNAANFSVTTIPGSSVSIGGSTTFIVRFTGTTLGHYNATLNIANNDCDEFNYTFAVTGEVTCSPAVFSSCPSNINVSAMPGLCSDTVSYFVFASGSPAPTFGHTFSGATVGSGSGTGSGSTFNVGTTNVSITATNPCSNPVCSFTVTVKDNQRPVFTVADVTVPNDPGVCGATINVVAHATDNCGVASLINDHPSTLFGVGPTVVKWTATDVNDNIAFATQTVTVTDNEAPVISTPGHDMAAFADANCSAAVPDFTAEAVATDNCSFTWSQTPAAGSIAALGHNPVHVVATDPANNSSFFDVFFDVTDNTPPSISAPSDIAVNTDPGVCGATVVYATPVGTDNCSVTTVQTTGSPSGNVFPVGVTTNTFVATDASHNTATCSFTVTVTDNELPKIVAPPNIAVFSDPSVCGAKVMYTAPIGTDNCASTTAQTAGLPSGSLFPVGVTKNCFTVTDASGNIAKASFTVTVTDNELPKITAPANIAVNNDPGVCGATVTYSTPVGTDNCASTTAQTAGLASGNVFPVGITTNTFVATDASGNTATCSFTVTVTDNELPKITAPANLAVNNDHGVCGATVSYATPVGTDNCASTTAQTAGLASGSVFPLGITTNTFVVTDASGNTATCSFTVKVTDNEPPTITIANVNVNNDAGLCSSSHVVLGTPTTGDNCGVASVTNNATLTTYPVGVSNVTWTVKDVNGNVTTMVQTITVTDNELPTMLFACSDGCGDHDGDHHDNDHHDSDDKDLDPDHTGDNHSNDHQGNSTNNNGHHYGDWNDRQVTWGPTPCPITVNSDEHACGTKVILSAPKVADNCGGTITVTNNAPTGNFFPGGVTLVTWTATDTHGNILTAQQRVEVIDHEKPKIKWTCAHHDEDDKGDDHSGDHFDHDGHDKDNHDNSKCDESPCSMTVGTDDGICGAHVTLVAPVATDNCAVVTLTNDAPAIFPVGKTKVTWKAVDAYGNYAKATQTVTVLDDEAPIVTVASTGKLLWPNNHKYTTISTTDMVASIKDNCDGTIANKNIVITQVTSDEKDNSCGQKDHDIVIAKDCQSVQLRAERNDGGNGRVYKITMMVQDAANNTATATYTATCPMTQTGIAVEDAVKYTELSKCNNFSKETASEDLRDAGRAGMIPNPDDNPIHLSIAPNPFRNTADVLFDVPTEDADQMVELKIFDMAGRDVTTLVQEVRSAGHYTATFNANDLHSGNYVAAVHTASHMQSKMMIVIK